MADVLTLADMPDLSDWRLAPLWTLEQAALLWAGINPAFFTFRDIWQEHPRKQARAKNCITGFFRRYCFKNPDCPRFVFARRKWRDLLHQPKNYRF